MSLAPKLESGFVLGFLSGHRSITFCFELREKGGALVFLMWNRPYKQKKKRKAKYKK
jgi:hypothetical protein